MTRPPRKVLLISHSPRMTTGYGRVTSVLARALAAAHEVIVLGLGYSGEEHDCPYRLLPLSSFGAHAEVATALAAHRPEVLLTIGDPWMFQGVPDIPRPAGTRWVAYFPVDGAPLPFAWHAWVRAADHAVVFCDFSRRVVEEATGVCARIIPHGVDTRLFAPCNKDDAKARVGVAGAFVVGTVAANQQRKNLPALIKAFAQFARGKDDVLLYLHTRIATGGYWDILDLVRRFGIESKTRATLNLDPQRGVPDPVLATVYNAFDVFVLPTMAEGFGLPIIESQACSVPALVTDYSACPELVPSAFCRLRVKDTLIMARNFEQALVDESALTQKLDRLYHNRTELLRLGCEAREFTQAFDWQGVCGQFLELIESL